MKNDKGERQFYHYASTVEPATVIFTKTGPIIELGLKTASTWKKFEVYEGDKKLPIKLVSYDTVKDYATSFYESLEYFELPSQLMTQRDELELAGLTEKAEEIDQVWNGLIQILDDLVTVFDDQEMTLQQFLDVFDIGLEQLEFVMIPQTLDQVSIGTMDLAKVDNKKHIYMVLITNTMNKKALENMVSTEQVTII